MFRVGGEGGAAYPLEDAQLTEPAGVGQGPVALHILKGVGGGARTHHSVPAQVAAGVPSGDGDLVAAAAQAREGGGEGTAAGVPGKGDRLAVHGEGHPVSGQGVLRGVCDPGGHVGAGQRQGHGGGGAVPPALVGQDQLVQPQGARCLRRG